MLECAWGFQAEELEVMGRRRQEPGGGGAMPGNGGGKELGQGREPGLRICSRLQSAVPCCEPSSDRLTGEKSWGFRKVAILQSFVAWRGVTRKENDKQGGKEKLYSRPSNELNWGLLSLPETLGSAQQICRNQELSALSTTHFPFPTFPFSISEASFC